MCIYKAKKEKTFKISYKSLSINCAPGNVVSNSHKLPQIIHKTILLGRNCYYHCFTNGELRVRDVN